MDLSKVIEEIKRQFAQDIGRVTNLADVQKIKNKYIGPEGELKRVFRDFRDLTDQEKQLFGQKINELKNEVHKKVFNLRGQYSPQNKETDIDRFIKTLPGINPGIGHTHIITQAIQEIVGVFKPLGFNRARHPEIEWEYFAFEALNIPGTHPARDDWETFFINAPADKRFGRMVITPHTSSGQVREMLAGKLPIKMLNISRCGRRQIDVNHVPTFYQFEGLAIDKGVNIAHLKGVLDFFAKNFFGPDRKTRLRPYNFRFTEPSFEVDINCGLCKGRGCRFCKQSGWVELGGAGMVHPEVLKYGKVDPKKYSGFAFGWGVERTYMMKTGANIDDIRYLFENDLRFLEQF